MLMHCSNIFMHSIIFKELSMQGAEITTICQYNK